jgi:hypothetical protein
MAYGVQVGRLGAFLRWWGTLDEDTRRKLVQVMMASSALRLDFPP